MTQNYAADQVATDTAPPLSDPLSAALQSFLDYLSGLYASTVQQMFTWYGAAEISVVLLTGLVALALSVPARRLYAKLWEKPKARVKERSWEILERIILPALWVLFLWSASAVQSALGIDNDLVRIVASLLNAWIFIRIITGFVPDPFLAKIFASMIWFVAALNILNLLSPAISLLDKVAITWGSSRVSLYLALKGAVLVVALLWAANALNSLIQKRIQKATRLTSSVKILISRV